MNGQFGLDISQARQSIQESLEKCLILKINDEEINEKAARGKEINCLLKLFFVKVLYTLCSNIDISRIIKRYCDATSHPSV
jgi:hypothetical protein